jgi:hypothetical protein
MVHLNETQSILKVREVSVFDGTLLFLQERLIKVPHQSSDCESDIRNKAVVIVQSIHFCERHGAMQHVEPSQLAIGLN